MIVHKLPKKMFICYLNEQETVRMVRVPARIIYGNAKTGNKVFLQICCVKAIDDITMNYLSGNHFLKVSSVFAPKR